MRKIFFNILLATVALAMQSCLHDNKEFFDASPAQRLDRSVTENKALLESATNGWKLEYYTGKEYSKGGYTFLLKFKDGNAFVSTDFAGSDSVSKSKYDVTQERGTVITFPTYNELMHKLAEAEMGNVDGEQGDYELVIMKTTPDSIYLQGKKWNNRMVMTRMPESVVWKTYLDSISAQREALLANYNIVVNANDTIGRISLNPGLRQLTIVYKDPTKEALTLPYCVTTTGIALPYAIDINAEKVSSFTWDDANKTLVSGGVKAAGYYPPGYKPIDFWVGNWTVSYNSGATFALAITKIDASTLQGSFTMRGLNLKFGLEYNNATGGLVMPGQDIEDPTGNYGGYWMAAVDWASGGRVTSNAGAGLNIKWDESTSTAVFSDNGLGGSLIIDSFAFFAVDATGNPVQNNGRYVIPIILSEITSMTK